MVKAAPSLSIGDLNSVAELYTEYNPVSSLFDGILQPAGQMSYFAFAETPVPEIVPPVAA